MVSMVSTVSTVSTVSMVSTVSTIGTVCAVGGCACIAVGWQAHLHELLVSGEVRVFESHEHLFLLRREHDKAQDLPGESKCIDYINYSKYSEYSK